MENIEFMKMTFFKQSSTILLTACLTVLLSPALRAQEFNFDEFLRAGAEDANTLIGNYMNPAMVGFGYSINGGWYNTAKTHGKLGFDLTVSVNAAQVPDSKEFFVFRNSDYSNIRLASGTSANSPTLMGSDGNTPLLEAFSTVMVNGQPQEITSQFQAPKGLGLGNFNVVPVPTANLGIGLIKNTDLKIRYVPEVNTEDFKMDLIGFGIMHDIKQYLPFVKRVPISLSLLAAYTSANVSYNLDGIGIDGSDQLASYDVSAWTAQLLVSKKLLFVTIYGGVGYNSATTDLKMTGEYVIQEAQNVGGEQIDEVVLVDPIDLSFDSNGVRATVGLKFALGPLTIHGDYTAQEYNVIAGGIGISIR